MKNYFKGFIKDIIPVLLGVLIALWINNWNEARKDQEYINNFYVSLKKELRETDKEITEKTPLQQALVDTLSVYTNNDALSLLQVVEKAGGINGPFIKLNYWKALSNSKIELIAFDKLSNLANIEEGNEILKYKRYKLLDFIYSKSNSKEKDEKMRLKMMVIEMMSTQRQIQNEIQNILKE